MLCILPGTGCFACALASLPNRRLLRLLAFLVKDVMRAPAIEALLARPHKILLFSQWVSSGVVVITMYS